MSSPVFKYNVGDQVRLIKHQDGHGKGYTGKVIHIDHLGGEFILYGVEFDVDQKMWSGAHKCRTQSFKGGIDGRCWWCHAEVLELRELQYDPTQQGDMEDDI